MPDGRIVEERGDPVEVTAGAEGAARAGENDRPGFLVGGQLPPDLGQRGVQRGVDGVQLVGPVDGDDADRAVGLDGQLGGQVIVHGCSAALRSPAKPRRPDPPGQLIAGRRQSERQPPQRLAVPGQPGQRGLVAEADRAVQLVSDPEHDVGRFECGQPQRQRVGERVRMSFLHAPQRVLGQLLDSGPLDLGVGELELHALERRQRLAELLALQHVRPGQVIARSSMPSSVQHGSTRLSGASSAPSSSAGVRARSVIRLACARGPARPSALGVAAASLRRPSR